MARYLLDTNILLRAANKTSAQHPATIAAMTALTELGHDLAITPQVLVEFWAVASRPLEANGFGWPTADVRNAIDRLLERFPLILEPSTVFPEWLQLATASQVIGKKAHDARLASLCRIEGVVLLTFNTPDFRRFGISTVSPDELQKTEER
jgi:predicted nucleic acid-binding protein